MKATRVEIDSLTAVVEFDCGHAMFWLDDSGCSIYLDRDADSLGSSLCYVGYGESAEQAAWFERIELAEFVQKSDAQPKRSGL